jgi:hypothetical protein
MADNNLWHSHHWYLFLLPSVSSFLVLGSQSLGDFNLQVFLESLSSSFPPVSLSQLLFLLTCFYWAIGAANSFNLSLIAEFIDGFLSPSALVSWKACIVPGWADFLPYSLACVASL